MVDHERDKQAYINLAEHMDKPKKTEQQKYWEDRANRLYLLTGKQMVVIKVDANNYQVWNKSLIGKMEYIYETEGGSDDAKID